MTYKQIEAAREARLWIGQIVVPAAIAVTTLMTVPEVRRSVGEKFNNVKEKVKIKKKDNKGFKVVK